jgi:hydrogenase expression/formation protein HypC
MCLGIPMKILEINQFMARCEAKGIERDVSLFMLQDDTVIVGDYIVVQMGYATQKMSEAEALNAWKIYDEMLLLEDQERQSTIKNEPPNR